MASQEPTHIAVLAFPFGTHAGPLLQLVETLTAAVSGTVTFSFLNTAHSNAKLFAGGRAPASVRPRVVADGWPEGRAPTRNPVERVEMFLRATPGNFAEALEAAETEIGAKAACVISDAFLWFAGDFAAERGVPWFPLWTAAPRSLFVHLATDEIRQRLGGQDSDSDDSDPEHSLDFLPGFSGIHVADLPEGVADDMDRYPFPNMLHKMGQSLPKATTVLINSFHNIDPQICHVIKARLQGFLSIGPFALTMPPKNPTPQTDEHGCLTWLSRHGPASVVYVSFGSVITLPPPESAALAAALTELGRPYLWSFRGAAAPEEGEKGKMVPWAPQAAVLGHASVAAFVTHCGWNSVLESVASGVPLVCLPSFGDQPLNASTAECVWRVGACVDVASKDGYLRALKRVVGEEEGKEMRQRMEVMKRLAYEDVADSSATDLKAFVELVKAL